MRVHFLSLFVLLSGCASLGPKFEAVQPAPKGKALVYVYRPSAFTGSARSPDVFVNEKKVGTVANGSYFAFEAEPGTAKILQKNFAGEETGLLDAQFKPNQTYFLRTDLGVPTMQTRFTASGKSTGQACPYQGLNLTLRGGDEELLHSMDKRAQSDTCWPGFMFVSEDLARRELPETKLSR